MTTNSKYEPCKPQYSNTMDTSISEQKIIKLLVLHVKDYTKNCVERKLYTFYFWGML